MRILPPFLGVLGGFAAAIWLDKSRAKKDLLAEISRIQYFVDQNRHVEIEEFWRSNRERLEDLVFRSYVQTKPPKSCDILKAWKNLTEMNLMNSYCKEGFAFRVVNDLNPSDKLISQHTIIICALETLKAQIE